MTTLVASSAEGFFEKNDDQEIGSTFDPAAIGLSFSGGGYRATLFHAGALVRHPSGTIEGAFDPRSDGDACGL